ncbi:unnamed protein product [Blepharisma stoltei]|uniref:choline-phosphate cytidylyltransferase n=1 Tax=Blepharisma stoltei TaxID=1481888 RepID=A0AAU9IZX1_9CILI|nr:unnamed protein product [Blepharisma stoltei]
MDIPKKRIRYSRASSARKKLKFSDDPDEIRILYVDTFDMFNVGHLRQLEKCKKLFVNGSLIVGIIGDENGRRKCLMSEYERGACVSQCHWVTDTICPCPTNITIHFLEDYFIDYLIVNEGEENDPKYSELKAAERIWPMKPVETLSTNDLLIRFIKKNDDFIERCLDKNISRHKLGIGIAKEWMIQSKITCKKVGNFFGKIKNYFSEELDEIKSVGETIASTILNIKKQTEKIMKNYVEIFEEKTEEFEEIVEQKFTANSQDQLF